MSMYDKLSGVFPPLVTPLDKEGNIDEQGLRKLVSRTIDGGVNGLVVLGTTGEGPVIHQHQRYRAVEIAVDEANERVPVIAGTGDVNTHAVKKNNREVAKRGAFCSMVIPPFYFPQNQQTMITFFRDIAQESPIPIIIYNFPQISKIYLEPATVEELSREDNIVGIKDSSANFVNFQKVVECQTDSFVAFQGVGALTASSLVLGCGGFISPVGNIDPEIEVRMYQAIKHGNINEAFEIQKKVNSIISLWRNNSTAPPPSIIKALLGIMGVIDTFPSEPNPKVIGESLEILKKKAEFLLP